MFTENGNGSSSTDMVFDSNINRMRDVLSNGARTEREKFDRYLELALLCTDVLHTG